MTPGPVVIRCLELLGRIEAVHHDGKTPAGEYLAAFDPEAHGGRGAATFTADLARAKVFPDVKAAWECIGTRPKKRPTRPDGKPNRPLMAFTLQILPYGSEPG
jgi:hypothetical protein